jgi:hypothetical protein
LYPADRGIAMAGMFVDAESYFRVRLTARDGTVMAVPRPLMARPQLLLVSPPFGSMPERPRHAAVGGSDHEGLKGGGFAMKTPRVKSAALPAQDSRNECGHDRVPTRVHPSGWINFLRTKKNHTSSMRGAAVGVRPLMRRIGGVDSVHTFGFGLGRTSVRSGRIPQVSGSSQFLQGLESGSSPTSGTVFPQVRGFRPLSAAKT